MQYFQVSLAAPEPSLQQKVKMFIVHLILCDGCESPAWYLSRVLVKDCCTHPCVKEVLLPLQNKTLNCHCPVQSTICILLEI